MSYVAIIISVWVISYVKSFNFSLPISIQCSSFRVPIRLEYLGHKHREKTQLLQHILGRAYSCGGAGLDHFGKMRQVSVRNSFDTAELVNDLDKADNFFAFFSMPSTCGRIIFVNFI